MTTTTAEAVAAVDRLIAKNQRMDKADQEHDLLLARFRDDLHQEAADLAVIRAALVENEPTCRTCDGTGKIISGMNRKAGQWKYQPCPVCQ